MLPSQSPVASIGTICASSGKRQRRGDPGFAPQLGVRGGLARAIRRAFGCGVAAQDGVIAGALDRGKQLLGLDGGGRA